MTDEAAGPPRLGVESGDEPTLKPGLVWDHRARTQVGNYIIHERLGRGGMAAVYRATHKGFGTQVAIKMLNPRSVVQPEMLARFLREAQAMREISEKNRYVVRAIDYGETFSGEAYLVMEYLNGQDLHQVLRTVGPLSWSRLAPIALQLCEALAATHAVNLIHRDIKPSNCFLTTEGSEQLVKLIDYGVAKDLRVVNEQTDEGVILGTPSYIAPEMIEGGVAPNPSTDIYALGATLYCLLTGKPPYEGPTLSDIAFRQKHETLIPPSVRRSRDLPRLSASVDEIILRALQPDPALRFHFVEDLADEIRLSMEPVTSASRLRAPVDPNRLTRGGLLVRTVFLGGLATALGVVLTLDPPVARAHQWRAGGASLAVLEPRLERLETPSSVAPIELPPASASDPEQDNPDAPAGTSARSTPQPTRKPADPPPPSAPKPPRVRSPAAAPMNPQAHRVRAQLDGLAPALRRECAALGNSKTLRFTLTLMAQGAVEAVDARPATFRECVRSTLRQHKFAANDGRYTYSLGGA